MKKNIFIFIMLVSFSFSKETLGLVTKSKGKVEYVVMNVEDLDSVKMATDQTKDSLGTIELLICNAGIAGESEKIWKYSPTAEITLFTQIRSDLAKSFKT